MDAPTCDDARRLWVLIHHLPVGSYTHAGAGWTTTHELLAGILEVAVNSRRKPRSRPFKVPRPRGEKKKRTAVSQLRALAGLLKRSEREE